MKFVCSRVYRYKIDREWDGDEIKHSKAVEFTFKENEVRKSTPYFHTKAALTHQFGRTKRIFVDIHKHIFETV